MDLSDVFEAIGEAACQQSRGVAKRRKIAILFADPTWLTTWGLPAADPSRTHGASVSTALENWTVAALEK